LNLDQRECQSPVLQPAEVPAPNAAPVKLSPFRVAVLLLRLTGVVSVILVRYSIFAVTCRIAGTSVKEVRRQARLRDLMGERRL
jgi:hypothetical protein